MAKSGLSPAQYRPKEAGFFNSVPGQSVQRRGAGAYAYFYFLFLLILFLTHSFLLDLPYFWDEMGQFIPAALDILREAPGFPHDSAERPSAGRDGVSRGLWTVVGYSVVITRAAMLALAAAGVLAVFALAVHLCKGLRGLPAFTAASLLLLASPLFYSQSMMAQLDMPAMVFTAIIALALF